MPSAAPGRGCYNGAMRLWPRLVPLVLLGSACDSLPPPPAPRNATEVAAPAAPSPAPVVPAPRLPTGATASVMQVQVGGRVLVPREAPAGSVLVALTDGPCFQLGTHYFTWAKAAPGGGYLLEAFPPVGTPLEACAAVIEPGRDRLSWWGRSDRGTMAVEGRGRMVYQATDIPLRRGPDAPLPVGLRLPN